MEKIITVITALVVGAAVYFGIWFYQPSPAVALGKVPENNITGLLTCFVENGVCSSPVSTETLNGTVYAFVVIHKGETSVHYLVSEKDSTLRLLLNSGSRNVLIEDSSLEGLVSRVTEEQNGKVLRYGPADKAHYDDLVLAQNLYVYYMNEIQAIIPQKIKEAIKEFYRKKRDSSSI